MRRFNTAGPCDPEMHYMLPAEERLPEARDLIENRGYFVVHAPRQTGKTTSLRALARSLTAEGRYTALHFTCEMAKVAPDVGNAEDLVLGEIRRRSDLDLTEDLQPTSDWPPAAPPGRRLLSALTSWARSSPRPLVIVFDEIDALRGETLVSVLSQLRAGFGERPAAFPSSIVLCGLRDVRDYKAASGGDPARLGTSSPFNIKLKSLRIGDFTESDLRSLYAQHSTETGQPFEAPALQKAWELSQGQPWLVNALAGEVVHEIGVSPPTPITAEHLDEAKERLILARQTHLDSLVARLMEARVRRVIEPLIAGEFAIGHPEYQDDVRYVRDLGLVTARGQLEIANPIYREVILRVLSAPAEDQVTVGEPRSYVDAEGKLDLTRLLEQFAAFWREHGDALAGGMIYHEVAPQLVLMGYLQRVVNGGGFIDREYGVGRGRIDLLVRWPWIDAGGRRQWQREAIELKVWSDKIGDPLAKGLSQLDGYLDWLDLDSGVLVVFDRRTTAAPIEERTRFEAATTPAGRAVTLLRA